MTISTTKKLLGATLAAGVIFALAGCGQAPTDSGDDGGDAGSAVDGFKPCMVSDEGGFDDKSFNQLGFEGLTKAADELGVEVSKTESKSASDYASNLDALASEGCTFIVSVGFKLSAPTIEAATANPDIQYAIIDDFADNTGAKDDAGKDMGDGKTDAPNIKPLVFDTAQAAFLGGYAAASYSESGTVGTFGGAKIPPVTIFMDGFELGVKYFNEEKGEDVKVVGWSIDSQEGQFTDEFAANDKAKQVAQGIIDQGADVLLPVGGPIYQSAAQAIRDSGGNIALMGTDADVFTTDPTVADLLLASIQKGMDVAVYDAVMEASTGDFDPTPFVGVLENDGVALSEFHDFESKVDPALADELKAIKDGIIDGSIKVESPASPAAP
ncbi:BMP family protein [Microbacterium sp. W4I20]|uniref:BMP family lipoprotein n=1 Tax=Microbacterium sp. W4I20 TaxID=3042262 RepID=UPI0027810638|nr:BMP family ABC transporter substrate-binding protein [Microbacterium sp. W4I20]MDQ0728956.1 basic membrane protein A [Microbacterium sp. W4I20]